MVEDQIYTIYEQAADAFENAFEEGNNADGALNPFVQQLRDRDFTITFEEASDLDSEYFGVETEYWAGAFDYPRMGDEVNTTYGDEIWNFTVRGRGLLTLDLETTSIIRGS